MDIRCLGCMEVFSDEFKVCPHCGYMVGTEAEEAIHMEPGTLLYDRYIIGKVLGYGGFGVTYLAWDGKLEQKVAVKEYLPGEFSTRMPGQTQVTIFNGAKNEQFQDGLNKFVEEAKHLAKFQNEAGIVKVFDSFTENDTAYIIMEYLDGETLTEYLKRVPVIPEDDAVSMLMPLMESLQTVHTEGLLHRDIAPDNIFLTRSGEVKLIDFGASRYATTSHSRSLTVIIKPGYSPEEQYRSRGDQGSHTDVYALAATLYRMITGKTPPDAMERRAKYENQNKDILTQPHKLNRQISLSRENAILNAMNVRIEDRTADIASFISQLEADVPAKRVYGKIKKIDLYNWPVWLKTLVPASLVLVITFTVLLLTGVIDFSLFSEEIVIPDGIVIVPEVEGLGQEEAFAAIESAQLLTATGGTVESEYIPAGKLILQMPMAGSYMEVNSTVMLLVSSGKNVVAAVDGVATVPYLVWDEEATALAKLTKAGLGTPEIKQEHDDNVSIGQVISQSIAAGSEVKEGTVITLTISLGAASFDMPDVSGIDKDEALSLLVSKGLVVALEYQKDNEVPDNSIISQSVKPGNPVKRSDEVTLFVSSGKQATEVVDVVGLSQDEAAKALQKQGFKLVILANHDAKIPAGKVISQTPAAGSAQLSGSTVTIYVSKGSPQLTVELNANGGSLDKKNVTVSYQGTYGQLPTPSRSGYSFSGWYLSQSGGSRLTATTEVASSSGHTLYARWEANSYLVSLNANGGTVNPNSINVKYESKYGDLPTPVRSGYGFNGWYTAATGGSKLTSNSTMSQAGSQTLYAQWTAGSYTVTLNANGGSVSPGSITVTSGGKYSSLPNPSRSGYSFNGWYTATTGGSLIRSGDSVKITSAQTLYAQWTAVNVQISYDANGGSVTPAGKTVRYGDKYGSLPVPTRSGYVFAGWSTAKTGAQNVTADTIVSTAPSQTIYALWTNQTYELRFDANGGSVGQTSKKLAFGSQYGDLPTPIRDFYSFTGWYTAKEGGAQVSSSTTIAAGDTTVYAGWTLKAESGWVLASTVPAGADITNRKWTYTRTETKTSKNASESGWTQTSSTWGKTGYGSTNYATFPAGFSTSHSIYTSFAKGPYTAFENDSTKRDVSNSWAGYVYWHWMYDSGTGDGRPDRAIYNKMGYGPDNGFYYKFFGAFLSSNGNYANDRYYCNSLGIVNYIIPDRTSWNDCQGATRWFRFDYYTSSYTDYQKIYWHTKVTKGLESTTKVNNGGEISNVQEYVRYREK